MHSLLLCCRCCLPLQLAAVACRCCLLLLKSLGSCDRGWPLRLWHSRPNPILVIIRLSWEGLSCHPYALQRPSAPCQSKQTIVLHPPHLFARCVCAACACAPVCTHVLALVCMHASTTLLLLLLFSHGSSKADPRTLQTPQVTVQSWKTSKSVCILLTAVPANLYSIACCCCYAVAADVARRCCSSLFAFLLLLLLLLLTVPAVVVC